MYTVHRTVYKAVQFKIMAGPMSQCVLLNIVEVIITGKFQFTSGPLINCILFQFSMTVHSIILKITLIE